MYNFKRASAWSEGASADWKMEEVSSKVREHWVTYRQNMLCVQAILLFFFFFFFFEISKIQFKLKFDWVKDIFTSLLCWGEHWPTFNV